MIIEVQYDLVVLSYFDFKNYFNFLIIKNIQAPKINVIITSKPIKNHLFDSIYLLSFSSQISHILSLSTSLWSVLYFILQLSHAFQTLSLSSSS